MWAAPLFLNAATVEGCSELRSPVVGALMTALLSSCGNGMRSRRSLKAFEQLSTMRMTKETGVATGEEIRAVRKQVSPQLKKKRKGRNDPA